MPLIAGPPVSPRPPPIHVAEWANGFSPFDDEEYGLLSGRGRCESGGRKSSKGSATESHIGPRDIPLQRDSVSGAVHLGLIGGEKVLPMERPWVQQLVGFVIICNLFCIGMEIGSGWPYWNLIELVFLCFYVVEYALRLLTSGGYGAIFQKGCNEALLNIFDLLLVAAGIVGFIISSMYGIRKIWFLPARLLRTVRVFRLFDVLSRFVGALQKMAHSLSWIFSVIALIEYVFAIYVTQYVTDFATRLEDDADFHYADVSTSMFTLFQVTTMDSWMDVAGPLINFQPYWRVFFVAFIVFTAWTMISLLTAVVSDTVISATYVKREEEKALLERRREEFVDFLERCFRSADADGNGLLDREEFLALINDDIIESEMERLGVAVTPEELRHTFDMLDIDESGELSIEEFTKGLLQLQQSLSIKHVVAINYAVERAEKRVQKKVEHQHVEVMAAIKELNQRVSDLRQDLIFADVSRQKTPPMKTEELEGYPT